MNEETVIPPMTLSMAVIPVFHPLGAITIGAPLLAWGLLAGLIPILVHLVLRERPRREAFPAMRFLLKSHASATRAQRLKHLILLMCRTLLVLIVVGMLARVGCMTGSGGAQPALLGAQGPVVSAVICIDDSASMGYRYQGRTRFQAATDWAHSLIEDHQWFGPGSQFVVISGSSRDGEAGWTSNPATARSAISALRAGEHSHGPADLLGAAYVLLASARHERREVYLFTDLTETSWRSPLPPVPEKPAVAYVMDVGHDENRNVALAWPDVPSRSLPAGIGTSLPMRVRTGSLAAQPLLKFGIDGQPRGQQATEALEPDREVVAPLPLPAMDKGTHVLSITLEPADALDSDNLRFACLSVGDLPRVGLVRETADNEVAALLAAMIAPPALAPGDQRYAIHMMTPSDLDTAGWGGMLAVIAADVGHIDPGGWKQLSDYAKGGGNLIVVPGPHVTPAGYRDGEPVLPARIAGIADCTPAVRPAAVDLAHPFLKPFADPDVDSINDRLVFKRLSLEPAMVGTRVVAAFSDGAPALLERPVGTGRSVMLAFSVAREWGQLGSQAAPMIVLLHTMLEALAPPARDVAGFAVDAPATWQPSPAAGPEPLLVKGDEDTRATPLARGTSEASLPTPSAGTYRVLREGEPESTLLHYSVNVAESESNLTRMTPDSIKSLFPNDLSTILRPDDPLSRTAPTGGRRLDWTIPLGLILLGLLIAESLFANRFYGFRSPIPDLVRPPDRP